MATLVVFHAHPDDESIATAGTMAKAAAAGHRVVLVVATKGEHGEVPEGFLKAGETLGERRVAEQEEAARIIGVHQLEWLGYVDSGMMGTAENELSGSFWTADVEEAAGRLAEILSREKADVLTVYDKDGTYGHPDHIQVHRVGLRAAEIARTPKVYESVVNRDAVKRGAERMQSLGLEEGPTEEEMANLGVPGELITTSVDAHEYIGLKRSAMAAHASQIGETSFFLAIPQDMFEEFFSTEDYVLRGAPPGLKEDDLFNGL
jgi:LmbE family N-acetylglucosaminyl deacetylase